MRKQATVLALAVFLLVGNVISPASATTAFNVNISDHFGGVPQDNLSYITTGMGNNGSEALCTGWDDPKCSNSLTAYVILPVCKSLSEANCVEALSITTAKVSQSNATFVKTIGTQSFAANVSQELPAGSNWSLFEFPALAAAGEVSKYSVKVKVDFQKFPIIGLKPKAFSATVVPYASGTTSMRDIAMYEWVNPLGVATVSGNAGDPKCIWTENGSCGVEVAFPKDAKVKLTIHLGNYLTSWLHGRLTEPTVDISAITKTQNRLVVEAAPVMTPSATALVPSSQVSPNIANNFRDPSGYLPPGEISMMTTASSDGAIKNFLDFEKFFADKATSLTDTWSFRSINPLEAASGALGGFGGFGGFGGASDSTGLGASAAKCLPQASSIFGAIAGANSTTALIGMVTTNALTYESGPPKFEDGFLNYKVAGVHSNPDGTDFIGKYDLVMDGAIARCLYGFGAKVPISATVSIVSTDAGSRVQSTLFKDDGNWIRLGAYGFTFSTPTLKIKLAQGGAAGPASPSEPVKAVVKEESAPTPKQEVATNSTTTTSAVGVKKVITKSISCVKGKIVRKISGSNPKCPSGFKKK
jgi:hypothetical protein